MNSGRGNVNPFLDAVLFPSFLSSIRSQLVRHSVPRRSDASIFRSLVVITAITIAQLVFRIWEGVGNIVSHEGELAKRASVRRDEVVALLSSRKLRVEGRGGTERIRCATVTSRLARGVFSSGKENRGIRRYIRSCGVNAMAIKGAHIIVRV
jgi:hypothetical protein